MRHGAETTRTSWRDDPKSERCLSTRSGYISVPDFAYFVFRITWIVGRPADPHPAFVRAQAGRFIGGQPLQNVIAGKY